MKPDTNIRERFAYSASSIAGQRPVNEDAWCVFPMGEGLVCAVADGIGGHEAGDVASALAIQIFEETVREGECTGGDPETAMDILNRGHTLAHAAIRQQATGKQAGMGTTLVSAFFTDGTISLCNTGDSRCTLIRRGTVLPLTTDHSFVQDLVDRDILTPEEATSHPMRNIITHSLGGDFVAECTVYPLCAGDTLVISSDGLHDYVSREMMILAGEMLSTEDAARLLMDEAAKTSTDNITLIVVRVHGEAIRRKEIE